MLFSFYYLPYQIFTVCVTYTNHNLINFYLNFMFCTLIIFICTLSHLSNFNIIYLYHHLLDYEVWSVLLHFVQDVKLLDIFFYMMNDEFAFIAYI